MTTPGGQKGDGWFSHNDTGGTLSCFLPSLLLDCPTACTPPFTRSCATLVLWRCSKVQAQKLPFDVCKNNLG